MFYYPVCEAHAGHFAPCFLTQSLILSARHRRHFVWQELWNAQGVPMFPNTLAASGLPYPSLLDSKSNAKLRNDDSILACFSLCGRACLFCSRSVRMHVTRCNADDPDGWQQLPHCLCRYIHRFCSCQSSSSEGLKRPKRVANDAASGTRDLHDDETAGFCTPSGEKM